MDTKLRDYQEQIYNKIKKAFQGGSKGIVAVLPCRLFWKILYNETNFYRC